MGKGGLAQIIGALLSGSLLQVVFSFLWRRLRRDPKSEAEARKINAEASHVEWGTLRDEIDRLTAAMKKAEASLIAQGKQIKELEAAADKRVDREAELERENKQLRTEVGRLRLRVEELEEILKLPTTPDDMKAQLDELHRKTSTKETDQ